MSKMKQAKAEKTDTEKILEDHRALKIETSGLTNKVKSYEKEVKTWETRFAKSQELEKRQKDESISLKRKLEQSEEKMRAIKSAEAKKSLELADSSTKKDDLQSKKEIQNLRGQNLQLQKKLKEVMDKSKGGSTSTGGAPVQSAKEKHLEKEKKRLQQEITKSKLEIDTIRKTSLKFKSDNMKLKNANDTYQRDVARLEKKLKSLASLSTKKAA
jgi:chromosome segregation ATPase